MPETPPRAPPVKYATPLGTRWEKEKAEYHVLNAEMILGSDRLRVDKTAEAFEARAKLVKARRLLRPC